MSAPSSADLPRNWARNIAASGAWKPGDPLRGREFHQMGTNRPFALEGGGMLSNAEVAYETWGSLNDAADNAILVCHALTGDSHAAGPATPQQPEAGWWDDLIGPGRAIDTDRWFVVCANVLGGCQGTTGPASINPTTGRPYGTDFPTVTIRDTVRAQASMATALGIDCWHSVIGGSMGGMQVIEWALMYPERVRSIASIASAAAASPWQIAWSALGRLAISIDPGWNNGDYYDAPDGEGPHRGLAVARGIANVTYRSDEIYEQRFGRGLVDPTSVFALWDRFQVESYLDHHGEKLARRFDANSYLYLNRMMDLHDTGRGRGSVDKAFSKFATPALIVSIRSDALYPPRLQTELAELARSAGAVVQREVIDSDQGHDGFLIETAAMSEAFAKFFATVDSLYVA